GRPGADPQGSPGTEAAGCSHRLGQEAAGRSDDRDQRRGYPSIPQEQRTVKKGEFSMRALVTLGIAALLAVPVAAQQQKQPAKAAPAPASVPAVTGSILETMDSGGYTYMRLKTDQGEFWSAVNQTKVKKGQTVTIATPMFLTNFESKTLHRTFDKIIFGTLAPAGSAAPQGSQGSAQLPPGHPSAGGATKESMAAQHSAAANPEVDAAPIKVTKAE